MKTVVSGKRTVEYVKPSKRELENELMDYLNTKGVHIDKDVWDETVDYILSFWDEQDYKPRDTYEAINDWYNDTKKFFPEMFGKGRKVASARYLRWIKNQRLIKSAKTEYEVSYPAGSGIKDKYITKDKDEAARFKKSGQKVKKHKTADERAKDEGADITCSRRPIKSMSRSYLKPEYDSRASFYNKAETEDDKLYSYGTLVAEIIDGKPVLHDDWDYSQTTIRHVKEFLRQHGFNAESKSQIARDYLTNSCRSIKSATGYSIEDYDPNISLSDNLYYQNPNVKPGLNSEMSFHLLDYAMEQGVPYDECKDWTYREWQDFVRSKSPKITNSRRSIKSSRESTENAYDVCEYCCNNLKPMYNKWFINKPNFEHDYAWFVVEHTDYSVRLYIQFMNTGFVYIEGTFTNGSTYDRRTIDSWRYEQEPSDITVERIKETLDDFFNSGINALRR